MLYGGYNGIDAGRIDYSGTIDNQRGLHIFGYNGIVLATPKLVTRTSTGQSATGYLGQSTSLRVVTDVDIDWDNSTSTVYYETITWVNGIMTTDFD